MELRVADQLQRRGMVTRRACLDAGMSGIEIDGLVRRGRWVAVRRGVYTTAARWSDLDEYVGRPLLVARAASTTMRTPHVLSHDSAALAWGLQVLRAEQQPVHITRPGVRGSRHEHGVHHHLAPYRPHQVVPLDGYAVLDRARTAVDVARWRGVEAGLVVADSALRAGVSRAALREAMAPMTCWPGITAARQAVDLADPHAENAAETRARLLVAQLGRGRPQTGVGLRDGSRTVWFDLLVGRQVFEFDGRVKYRPVAAGGVALDSPSQVAWAEKRRRDHVQSFRLGVSRIVWEDLDGPGRRAALVRLEQELAATERLFGTDTADLAPYLITRRSLPHAV